MLMKWLWEYCKEENSLWMEASKQYMVLKTLGAPIFQEGPHGVGLWKNIRKLWCEFSPSSSFKLGSVPTFNSGKTNG